MPRNASSEQFGPTTRYGRQIVYDREIFISICERLLRGEDLRTICAKPPMPPGQVFLWWVQDHPEARAIYRSVDNFRSDRALAKQLGVIPARATVAEWEEDVRANCERGWPADYIERKNTPPDWNKVYPLLGGPPVLSTEDIDAYTELLDGFTEMLGPRDMMAAKLRELRRRCVPRTWLWTPHRRSLPVSKLRGMHPHPHPRARAPTLRREACRRTRPQKLRPRAPPRAR